MFNDEDLKRLKAYHKGRGYYIPTSGPHVSLWDILARLDAAEYAIAAVVGEFDDSSSVQAWRKSAGKETK